jgi:hypothetical protein
MTIEEAKNLKAGDWVEIKYPNQNPIYGELDYISIQGETEDVQWVEFSIGGCEHCDDDPEAPIQIKKMEGFRATYAK